MRCISPFDNGSYQQMPICFESTIRKQLNSCFYESYLFRCIGQPSGKKARGLIKNSCRAAKSTAGVPATTTTTAPRGHETATATVPADAANDGQSTTTEFPNADGHPAKKELNSYKICFNIILIEHIHILQKKQKQH